MLPHLAVFFLCEMVGNFENVDQIWPFYSKIVDIESYLPRQAFRKIVVFYKIIFVSEEKKISKKLNCSKLLN